MCALVVCFSACISSRGVCRLGVGCWVCLANYAYY